MGTYLLRRLLLMFPTLIGVTMVVFFVMAFSPGGFGAGMLNELDAQSQGEEAKRIKQYFMRRYGLDQPKYVQYGRWLNQVSPLGFKTSDQVTLTDEQDLQVERILTGEQADMPESRIRASVAIVEAIAAYSGRDPIEVANELRASLDDPANGLSLFDDVDAKVDPKLKEELIETQARSDRLARLLLIDRLGFEALGRSRILFASPTIKSPDLGKNLQGRKVSDILVETVPITLLLNAITIPLIYIVAIWTGIYAARHRGKAFDVVSSAGFLALWSIPTMLAGVLLIGYLGNEQYLKLFPSNGLHSLNAEQMAFLPHWSQAGFERGWLLDAIWHLILPIICLTYGGFAYLSKLMRGSVLENLSADYVRTARAKGVADRDVLFGHVFRNSVLPLITVAANLLPALLVGSVIVETIFSINGMGRLSIDAAFQKDREVVMGTVLIASLISLASQIARDICYAIADPRVTYE